MSTMFSDSTDTGLLMRLHEPELRDAAWKDFVVIYTPGIWAVAKSFRLQEADAEDVTQAVLSKIYLGKYQRRPGHQFRSWLREVTRNECRLRLRQERDRQYAVGGTLPEVPDEPETPAFVAAEETAHLTRVLERAGELGIQRQAFTEKSWRVFWAKFVKKRPAKEVAVEFGMKTGAIYSVQNRVLAWLRDELPSLLD